jgi:hypothetical protein
MADNTRARAARGLYSFAGIALALLYRRRQASAITFRASNKKASNAEIAENDSRVFDKGNGLFCFSRRPAAAAKAAMAEVAALRPLRFILLQALSPPQPPGGKAWHDRAGF